MVKVSGRKFIPAQDSSAEVTRGLSIGTSTNTDLGSVLPAGDPPTHPITAVVSLCDSMGVAHGADTKSPPVARLGRAPPAGVGVAEGQGAAPSHGQLRDAATTHAAHLARPNVWHEVRSFSQFPRFAFASGRGSHGSPSDAAS